VDAIDPRMTPPIEPASSDARHRPFGVLVVALVQTVTIGLSVVGALTDIGLPWQGVLTAYLREHAWTRLVVLAVGIGLVVAVIGLWRLRPWGWALMVSLVGASLLLGLMAWWQLGSEMSLAAYVRLFLDVVCAFYLNTTAVQEAFRRPPAGSGPSLTTDVPDQPPIAGTRSAGRVDP
jgi:hypothetical protein